MSSYDSLSLYNTLGWLLEKVYRIPRICASRLTWKLCFGYVYGYVYHKYIVIAHFHFIAYWLIFFFQMNSLRWPTFKIYSNVCSNSSTSKSLPSTHKWYKCFIGDDEKYLQYIVLKHMYILVASEFLNDLGW